MTPSRKLKIIDGFITAFIAVAIVAGLISIGTLLYNSGYKSGYCSALNGEPIGGARVCNVDGRVVDIP